MSPLTIYHLFAYYLTLGLFAGFGLALSIVSFVLGWLPSTDQVERFFQRVIHAHFCLFLWWCEMIRVMVVRHHGFARLPGGGAVIIANHPALIDITCLLARIPEAVCVFKPAIRRNPVLGAAARRAGYLAGDGGHDLVRAAAVKLAAGHRLVIFPEGTRTPRGSDLLPFKPGFALMAQCAGVPIQLVRITTNSDVLTKGRAWWKLSRMPIRVDLVLGPLMATGNGRSPAELTAEVERWYREPESAPTCLRDGAAFASLDSHGA